jgi:hypothetical protein
MERVFAGRCKWLCRLGAFHANVTCRRHATVLKSRPPMAQMFNCTPTCMSSSSSTCIRGGACRKCCFALLRRYRFISSNGGPGAQNVVGTSMPWCFRSLQGVGKGGVHSRHAQVCYQRCCGVHEWEGNTQPKENTQPALPGSMSSCCSNRAVEQWTA